MTYVGAPPSLVTLRRQAQTCNPFYSSTPVPFTITTPEVAFDLLKKIYKANGNKLKECPPDLLFFYLVMTECAFILFEDYQVEIHSTLEIDTGKKDWCDGFNWWSNTREQLILEGKELLGETPNKNSFTFRDQRLFQHIADMSVGPYTKVALFFESCRYENRVDQDGQPRRTPLAYVERLVSEFK